MQTRTMSAIEVGSSYTIGFIIAWGIAYYILPYWGFRQEISSATSATILFTIVSVVRTYSIRRFFNWLYLRASNNRRF